MSDSKRVFITGTSGGFGYNAAKALAERGHTVYATMRGTTGKNEAKAAELRDWAAAGGHALHVYEVDVTDDASVNTAVNKAIAAGGIDVVINNAGFGNWGIDEGFTVEQAQALLNVNLFGVMRVNRAVMPHLREAGKGLLMYISSGLGRIVFPFLAVYNASKHALEGYAHTVHYEVKREGIETVIVQPGAYGTSFLFNSQQPKTDMLPAYGPGTQAFYAAFAGGFEERAKGGQLGDPAEVTAAIVEEVERPAGDRPLRHTVGADVKDGVTAINQAVAGIQGYLEANYGL